MYYDISLETDEKLQSDGRCDPKETKTYVPGMNQLPSDPFDGHEHKTMVDDEMKSFAWTKCCTTTLVAPICTSGRSVPTRLRLRSIRHELPLALPPPPPPPTYSLIKANPISQRSDIL